MTVRVDVTVERAEDDLTWVRCRLVSDLANSKGEVFGEREHHEARFALLKNAMTSVRSCSVRWTSCLKSERHLQVNCCIRFVHLRPIFPRPTIPIPRGCSAGGRRRPLGH